MTREERVSDGREKFEALKTRAKEGFANMMGNLFNVESRQRAARAMDSLKDAPYAAVSVGYEAASNAKEALLGTPSAIKSKAAELFGRGREAMVEAKGQAHERKEARQTARQERRDTYSERRDRREAHEAMRVSQEAADERATAYAEYIAESVADIVERAQEEKAEKEAELEEIKELQAQREAEAKAASDAAKAAEQAKKTIDVDPNASDADRQHAKIDMNRKLAESVIASANLDDVLVDRSQLESAIQKIDNKMARASESAEAARDRIAARMEQAKLRKQWRRHEKREARKDIWVSAQDRLAQVTGDATSRIRSIGQSVRRYTSGVANGMRSVIKGMRDNYLEGWREMGDELEANSPEAIPTRPAAVPTPEAARAA